MFMSKAKKLNLDNVSGSTDIKPISCELSENMKNHLEYTKKVEDWLNESATKLLGVPKKYIGTMIEKAHSKLIEHGTTLNREQRQELIDELLILFNVSKSVCPLCDGKGRRIFKKCTPPIDEICPVCKGLG